MLPRYSLLPKPTRLPSRHACTSATLAVDARRLFGRAGNFYRADAVTLKEISFVEQRHGLRFALNKKRKLRMRNEQALADVQHDPVQIVRAHDQLGRALRFHRHPRQNVAALHDVFLFLGRRIFGEQDFHVHIA